MNEPTELRIRVRFTGADSLPTMFVAQSLAIVEDEVFEIEYEELEAIFSELKEVPQLVRDACFERIRHYAGGAFLLEDAAKGSLILLGVAAALSYWIVENTIGESFKEAWKQSELHDKLKNLFLTRIGNRGNNLKSRLNQRFFKPVSDPTVIPNVTFHQNGHALIDVELKLAKFDRIPPTPKSWTEKKDTSKEKLDNL